MILKRSIKRIITQNLIVEIRNLTVFKLLKMLKYLQKEVVQH